MKQNDILLYGALAIGAYFLLKPKAPAAVPVTTLPANSLPVYNPATSNTSQPAVNPISTALNSLTKLLSPGTSTPPVDTNQAAATADFINQTSENILPVTPLPVITPYTPPAYTPPASTYQAAAPVVDTPVYSSIPINYESMLYTTSPAGSIDPYVSNTFLKNRLISGTDKAKLAASLGLY